MCNDSLVYLNKVFSDTLATSAPILAPITTDGTIFTQQLIFSDENEGCCCNNCNTLDMDEELTFMVESTEVIVSDIRIPASSPIDASNVSVNGINVDNLELFNDMYSASTNMLMSQVSDCSCIERNRSTSGYFLITGINNWRARLTLIVRGSAFGCGTCKRFKLILTAASNTTIPIAGSSTFAVPSICLPCTQSGVSPVINFSFGANATLLNPEITVNTATETLCDVVLTGNIILEPFAKVQVTRATLFSIDAKQVFIPCDDVAICSDGSWQCGYDDDDSNALFLRNKCCKDAPRDAEKECEDKKKTKESTYHCHTNCNCRSKF